MNDLLLWLVFAAVIVALVPLSQLVQRVTGRKGAGSGASAFGYYVVLGAGVFISIMLLAPLFAASMWGTAALGGMVAGAWSLVAQAFFGEKRIQGK